MRPEEMVFVQQQQQPFAWKQLEETLGWKPLKETLGAQYSVESGEVVVRIPDEITAPEVEDVKELFELIYRQLRRHVAAKETA